MQTVPSATLLYAITWRRAVKVFDTAKKVSDADLRTILEAGRMAPSAYGIEPWKFIVVENTELREKLRAAAYNQAQVTDASRLIVVARHTDGAKITSDLMQRTAAAQGKTLADFAGFEKMVGGAIAGKDDVSRQAWFAAQTYIPLGVMMQTASLMGIDNAGMEGFDSAKVDEILGLPAQGLASQYFFVLGYRSEADVYSKSPKVRRGYDEVVKVV